MSGRRTEPTKFQAKQNEQREPDDHRRAAAQQQERNETENCCDYRDDDRGDQIQHALRAIGTLETQWTLLRVGTTTTEVRLRRRAEPA